MLSQLYSAMVEKESMQLADDRRERQMRRPAPAPSVKDIEQDRRIRALEHENQRLKAYMAGLVELMLKTGVIEHDDINALRDEAMRESREETF